MAKRLSKRIRWNRLCAVTKRRWEDRRDERVISVRVTIQAGRMIDFAVVLRAPVAGELREIARYDYAHGFIHIDIQRQGDDPLRHQYRDKIPLKEAVRYASDDFQENWEKYLAFYLGEKSDL